MASSWILFCSYQALSLALIEGYKEGTVQYGLKCKVYKKTGSTVDSRFWGKTVTCHVSALQKTVTCHVSALQLFLCVCIAHLTAMHLAVAEKVFIIQH